MLNESPRSRSSGRELFDYVTLEEMHGVEGQEFYEGIESDLIRTAERRGCSCTIEFNNRLQRHEFYLV